MIHVLVDLSTLTYVNVGYHCRSCDGFHCPRSEAWSYESPYKVYRAQEGKKGVENYKNG